MDALRRLLMSGPGKVALAVLAIGAIGLMVWSVWGFFGRSGAGEDSRTRWFVCADTGKGFQGRIDEKTTLPVKSPFSGKATGYLAELCYWGKDGGVMKEPTAVLLESTVGREGPTFCPECGRMVVGQNPYPYPGDRPPPTREEYAKRASHAMN